MRSASKRAWSGIAALVVGAGLLVGAGARAGAPAGGAETADAQAVAAVDGRPVTRAELEERAAAGLAQLEQQRHRLLETALEELVEERLLAAAAARRGTSPQALLASELAARTAAVTDEEVEAWYQANRARVPQPLEQVAPQVRAFLERERGQQARRELLAALRSEHRVEVRMEPFRLEVAAAEAPAKGPAGAPVTVVEFSDFQCPWCQRITPALDRLREAYGARLRLVFRQFPLHTIHPQAQKAAEASLCARDQGKFWPMHDVLFAHQDDLGVENLKALADELGLDRGRFDACLDGGERRDEVLADVAAGRRIGVGSTPSLFVNGRPVNLEAGPDPFDQLAAVVDDELARRGMTPGP